jgi:diacylglycerol O-acyltransferase
MISAGGGAKLPLLSRYRQRVRFVPGQLGRPVWVDDAHFNLAYHVRHSALPPPGGEEELRDPMGRLMAVELDRHRPLWEVIEGLAGGRWALISKVHHCMVDGISGTDLMVQLLDSSRRHRKPRPEAWAPSPEPSEAELVVSAIVDLLSVRTEQVRAVRALLRRPRSALAALADTMDGAMALGRSLQPTPPTLSIEGAIGPHRRWAVAGTSLDELKAIRSTLGGTVNDVVLTAITGAFRDLLFARGQPVDDVVIHSLVPGLGARRRRPRSEQPGRSHDRRTPSRDW